MLSAKACTISWPAAYGVPIFFGSDYAGYPEAYELIQRKGAYSIRDSDELRQIFQQLYEDENLRAKQGENSRNYILEHIGGTEEIVGYYENKYLHKDSISEK